MSKFENFFNALAEACENIATENEEKKAELRHTFEDLSDKKTYNRGTVISAMAEKGWDSYDMKRVLEYVTTTERAEAAVGLIASGNYDYYDICRIIEKI